jgi:hypothetical protein
MDRLMEKLEEFTAPVTILGKRGIVCQVPLPDYVIRLMCRVFSLPLLQRDPQSCEQAAWELEPYHRVAQGQGSRGSRGKRRDWHLTRLWLGPHGGGAIVGSTVRREMMPATHGDKQFLVKERQRVPVASYEMFVGRRRELQKALRDSEHAGMLLHGMGRLGKSSLAARIANRRGCLHSSRPMPRAASCETRSMSTAPTSCSHS